MTWFVIADVVLAAMVVVGAPDLEAVDVNVCDLPEADGVADAEWLPWCVSFSDASPTLWRRMLPPVLLWLDAKSTRWLITVRLTCKLPVPPHCSNSFVKVRNTTRNIYIVHKKFSFCVLATYLQGNPKWHEEPKRI